MYFICIYIYTYLCMYIYIYNYIHIRNTSNQNQCIKRINAIGLAAQIRLSANDRPDWWTQRIRIGSLCYGSCGCTKTVYCTLQQNQGMLGLIQTFPEWSWVNHELQKFSRNHAHCCCERTNSFLLCALSQNESSCSKETKEKSNDTLLFALSCLSPSPLSQPVSRGKQAHV